MQIIKFCNKFFYNNKISFLLYIFLTLIISLLRVSIPYIIGKFIDILSLSFSYNSIHNYCILFFLVNLLKIIFEYLQSVLFIKVQTSTAFNINSYILNHIKKIPISFFNKTDISYLNQRINADSNSIVIFTINIFSDILTNSIILIFVIGLLIKINFSIIFVILFLVISYIILYFSMKKVLYKNNYMFKESQANFFSKLHEQLYNTKFIKLHSVFNFFENRLTNSYLKLFKISIKTNKVHFLFKSIEESLTLSSQCLLLFLGALAVVNGSITIGLFTIISNYFNMLLNSLKYFIGVFQNYQENLVSFNRIQDILKIPKETNGQDILDDIISIELKNIKFNHGKSIVFNDYSYKFEKGNIYFIVGQNGCGKSTLIDILLGIHIDEFQGDILYNNSSIKNIDLYKLREENIGIVEQEPLLVSDTIFNNLKLINKSCNEDKINYLLNYFDIYDIKDKIVQENSTNLSGGEKQKISIIRELLKNPSLIIFDEPTSALDKKSKIKFYKLIEELNSDKSKLIIIITHDKELIDLSNNIIVLDNN